MNDAYHKLTSSPEAALEFGRHWADCWNRGDVKSVLAHFAPDCIFESPLAEKHAGQSRVMGKEALAQYWQAALAAIGSVEFAIDFVATAPVQRAITIVYRARLGQRHVHACERLIFNAEGLVSSGMGLYGPSVVAG